MSAIAPVLPVVEENKCVNCGDVVKTPTVTEFELGAVRGVNKLLLKMVLVDSGEKLCDGCHKPFVDSVIASLTKQKIVSVTAEKASDNDTAKPVSAPIIQQEIVSEPTVTATQAETPKVDEAKVVETVKYTAPAPKPAEAKAEKTELPKSEPKAEEPKVKAEEKHVFSGLAQVVMSIIDNDGTVRGGTPEEKTRKLPNGIKQTRCIVAINNPSACICGGWDLWDRMPAIVRRLGREDKKDPSFGFGAACAAKATAEFLSQKGYTDPFKSGITIDVAILGYKSDPQVPFTASAEETTATGTTVAKPIAAADVGYGQLATVFKITKPVMGEFKSVQEAFGRTALLADISKTLGGEFVKNPSAETLAKMIGNLEKIVFNGAVQTVTWGRITPEAARRLSGDALFFSQEARTIASRMTVQPPTPKAKPIKAPAPVTAPQAPAEESADVATKPVVVAPKMTAAARKAARSAADIALRESMKSKKGEQGGKGKKK